MSRSQIKSLLFPMGFILTLFAAASCSEQNARGPATQGTLSYSTKPVVLSDKGNRQILNFNEAKKLALQIHKENPVTIYCPCRYSGKSVDIRSCGYKVKSDAKRAARLEWEHVVPAEAFGQAFREWREGDEACVKHGGKKFKGRKCAETNAEFNRMEADLYNLWPAIGELNGLRSNFSMAAISGTATTFGDCLAKIQDRKFEPMEHDKGIVARTYMYMEENYPGRGIISEKNRKLFEAWDREHPVSDWECKRARKIREIQGNDNTIVASRCQARATK